MIEGKKVLWILIIGMNSFIAAFIILLSRVCFYIDTIDGTYMTEPTYYIPKEALVILMISIVVEIFIIVSNKKQDKEICSKANKLK